MRFGAALALAALVTTAAVHHGVLRIHFWFDDFFVIRPWSGSELAAALTGAIDPLGNNELYHRPLTALAQAALFPVFGLNAAALHLISLVLVVLVAWLLGLFVMRETGRRWLALWAMALFVAHPGLPDAASALISTHYHLIGCLLAALSLLVWQRVRTAPARRWWPLLLLMAIGFYVKEDNVMLLPGLLFAQWARARLSCDLPAPPRMAIVAAAGLLALLAGIRVMVFPYAMDPSVVGVAWSSLPDWIWSYGVAPYHALMRIQTDALLWVNVPGEISLLSSLAVTTMFCAGVIALVWLPRSRGNSLFIVGMGLMAFVGLPLAFATGPTRAHLVIFAAALTLAGGASTLASLARRPATRLVGALAALATLLVLAADVRATNDELLPCSRHELLALPSMAAIPAIPDDLHRYLLTRAPPCESGTPETPLTARGIVFWRVGPWVTDPVSGRDFRWTAEHAVALVCRCAKGLTLTIRHPEAAPSSPIVVTVKTDGSRVTRAELRSPDWTDVHVELVPGWWTRARDSYRVDLLVDRPADVAARGVAMQAARVVMR